MPLHDFACRACDTTFEELTKPDELPPCPACGSTRVDRLLSVPARPPKFGLRGGDARRSEAARRAAREKKRESRGKS
jgi:putative FmdB family regulatory protein